MASIAEPARSGEARLYEAARPECRELFCRSLLEVMLRREREAAEREGGESHEAA